MRRLSCNALIQPHFGYECIPWTLCLNDDNELLLWDG